MGDADLDADPGAPATAARGLALAVAVGIGVGLTVVAFVYAIIAIPLYALAQSDPHGLDRPFFRHALVRIAVPAGLLVGAAIGGLVGVWYGRGGRLPTDRNPHER